MKYRKRSSQQIMSRLRKSLALGLLRERASSKESAICGGSARTGWWLGCRAEQNSSMNDQSYLSKRQRLTVKVCRSASDLPSWCEQLKSVNSFWSWQAIKSEIVWEEWTTGCNEDIMLACDSVLLVVSPQGIIKFTIYHSVVFFIARARKSFCCVRTLWLIGPIHFFWNKNLNSLQI